MRIVRPLCSNLTFVTRKSIMASKRSWGILCISWSGFCCLAFTRAFHFSFNFFVVPLCLLMLYWSQKWFLVCFISWQTYLHTNPFNKMDWMPDRCRILYSRGLKLAVRGPFAALRAILCSPRLVRKCSNSVACARSGPPKGLSDSSSPCPSSLVR